MSKSASRVFSRIIVLSAFVGSTSLWAGIEPNKGMGRLPTHLTAGELAREALDEQNYPNFMRFVKTVDTAQGLHPTDVRNKHLIKSAHYFTPTPQMWTDFFKAAAADRLTCLRAFALLAREIKKNGVVVFGPGGDFEKAVNLNNVDLGLALPAKSIGGSVWTPDPSNKDPEFLVHIKVFYSESYVHQFPDEILPANLKIGYSKPEPYWINGQEYVQSPIDADIYYGPKHGVGFRNVKGVGGQKRGVLGFFQKVLFFLPDAIDSMTIREDKGEMVTEALINTTVKNFEKNPVYSIKIKDSELKEKEEAKEVSKATEG